MANPHDRSDLAPIREWLSEIDRLRALSNGDSASNLNFLLSQPPPNFAEVVARWVISVEDELATLL